MKEVVLNQSIITKRCMLYESTVQIINEKGKVIFEETLEHHKSPIPNASKNSLERPVQFLRKRGLIVAEFNTNYRQAHLPAGVKKKRDEEVIEWRERVPSQSGKTI